MAGKGTRKVGGAVVSSVVTEAGQHRELFAQFLSKEGREGKEGGEGRW